MSTTTMHTSILILLSGLKMAQQLLAVYSQLAIAANDDIPKECRDLTYCTVKPPNYPQEKFNNMFKHLEKILIEPPPAPEIILDNRGSIPGEEDDCVSKITVDDIYLVREGLDKPWRTVVQAPGVDYVQKVRLEVCQTPNASCFKVFTTEGVSEHFVTFCQQNYIYYNFLVEKSKGSTETETVKAELPACCSCRYKPAKKS